MASYVIVTPKTSDDKITLSYFSTGGKRLKKYLHI